MRSCLKLFSRLFEVPEAEVRGYLDMYFQLRLRAEEVERIAAPVCALARNDGKCGVSGGARTLDEDGGRQIAAPTEKAAVDAVGADIIRPRTLAEDGVRQIAAPTEKAAVDAVGADIIRPRTLDEDGAGVDPSPAAPELPFSKGSQEPEAAPVEPAASIAKKPRPKSRGNDYAAKAALFKREVREKLAAARAAGVTSGMIMEKVKPGSALTQGKLLDIMGARLAPVEAYRVLDEVLDTLEAASKE